MAKFNPGILPYALLANTFQGRIERTSATVVTLNRYNGDLVVVNNVEVAIGTSGIALATTDNLITATGADAGAAMAASTLYYVYVSNSSASFAPSDLRASATAPSRVSGVYYLGTSGNALNWRFVGYVRTSSATEFVDTETDRGVSNYYNRRPLTLRLRPGYVDDNLVTTYVFAAANFTAVNGGTGATMSFIANGEDAVTAHLSANFSSAAGSNGRMGLGIDSTTQPENAQVCDSALALETTPPLTITPAQGYHTISMLIQSGGVSVTVYADHSRLGAAADVPGTMAYATVMG